MTKKTNTKKTGPKTTARKKTGPMKATRPRTKGPTTKNLDIYGAKPLLWSRALKQLARLLTDLVERMFHRRLWRR